MKVTAAEVDYTSDQIRQAVSNHRYMGWGAESCGSCRKTANVLAGGPGWFCPCGQYNVQSWSHRQFPHEAPDYGPSGPKIREALQTSIP